MQWKIVGCLILLVGMAMVVLMGQIVAAGEPTSFHYIGGDAISGNNGWYQSSIEVTIESSGTPEIASITYWLDSDTPTTVPADETSVIFSQTGEHTLYYYATNESAVDETPTNEFDFKIDTDIPSGWNSFTATQNGGSTLYDISVALSDQTSGLDSSSVEIQYSTDGGSTWGYYNPTDVCNPFTWQNDAWLSVTPSFGDGDGSGTIDTPTIDVCDTSWTDYKIIKFRLTDMAGQLAQRQYCLFCAWFQAANGDVFSEGNVSLTAASPESNAEHLLISAGNVSNVTAINETVMESYSLEADADLSYAAMSSRFLNVATELTGDLPTSSGWYYVSGDLDIDGNVPAGFESVTDVARIILVDGDVSIEEDLISDESAFFGIVASGDIDVSVDVERLDGWYLADGEFDSSYDGTGTSQLLVNGNVLVQDGLVLGRSLSDTDNGDDPAEKFVGQMRYYLNLELLNLLIGEQTYTWYELED
jgi:hypothetical protein